MQQDHGTVGGTPSTWMWPRPCPTWCVDHTDHPADPGQGEPPQAYHEVTIDTWYDDKDVDRRWPNTVTVWAFTYPEDKADCEDAYVNFPSDGIGNTPAHTERVAAGLARALQLIDQDRAAKAAGDKVGLATGTPGRFRSALARFRKWWADDDGSPQFLGGYWWPASEPANPAAAGQPRRRV